MSRRILPLLLLLSLAGCAGQLLMNAVPQGDAQAVMTMIDGGASTKKCWRCPGGRKVMGTHVATTVLGCAAFHGRADLVQALLAEGVPTKNKCIDSALGLSALRGHSEIAAALIGAGADPDSKMATLYSKSSLQVAAEYGHPGVVGVLLDAGATLDAQMGKANKESSFTALMFASESGRTDVVKVLLAHCPDAALRGGKKARYGGGWTAQQLAQRKDHVDVVELLKAYRGRESCRKSRKRMIAKADARKIAEIEAAARSLEKKDPRAAINKYAELLAGLGDGGSDEIRTRIAKRIFRAAAKLKLSVPKEAKRFAIRAQVIVKEAKSKADFEDAILEIKKALRAAPWWPEAYFNLGLIQEKAGQPVSAMSNLKLYLAAKPGARDAAAVERKIIELEVKIERGGR